MQNLLTKLAARPALAIFACSLLLFCSGSWILPLTDRDEPRFAEASREMLQRGDYIVPWFNGQHRFDKPPLIYWSQMACYKLLGENAFAARFPSALFAAGIFAAYFFSGCGVSHKTADGSGCSNHFYDVASKCWPTHISPRRICR